MGKGYDLPERQLVSQQDQAVIQAARVPRSKFINQWTRKTAFDAGKLIPICVDEILPGDHMRYDVTAYVRMATPLYPIFDNQRVDTFWFFVPNRILWTNWVKFMGEQDSPNDSIAFSIPRVQFDTLGPTIGSLADHMGIPVGPQFAGGGFYQINSLPFRAYMLIYNTWFRDENSIGTLGVPYTGNGPDANTEFFLCDRAKSKDYFTSALPWPQKFAAPTVPLGGLAPVIGIGAVSPFTTTGSQAVNQTTGSTTYTSALRSNNNVYAMNFDTGGSNLPLIYADLAASSGVAINTLRQAFLVQQLVERDARGGTRYTELIRSHFGVINPDFRLQRPEYIGGGQSPLNITPVAATTPTAGVPVGALGGTGTAAGRHTASYAATEHGYIIGLINVKSEISYQQGIHKMYNRSTRYDFYWPTLAGLGEQAVLRREIYATGVTALDDTVFGYQERWQEYRTRYSDVTGIMRSYATGTLDAWHLAQRFTSPPGLNSIFLADTPPMARVLAAGALANGQQYLADILFNRVAVRPLPTFGTPVTLGSF